TTMPAAPGPSQGTSPAAGDPLTPSSKSTYEGLKLTYTSPRLNKKNYVDWAAKTEILLDIQRVWTIVHDDEQKQGDKTSVEAAQDWRKRNAIALAILGGSIEETEYRTIRSIKNSAE